jgi:hypothetical protein
MKICLYTITDFSEGAVECIDLLLNSIVKDINYDFYILTNLEKKSKYSTIKDDSLDGYLGFLKYSPQIPNYYDYYIYLDSDILYFDTISSLLPIDKKFTIVTENMNIGTHEWFYFKNIDDPKQDSILQNCRALNAGSFVFRNDHLFTIHNIYNFYKKYYINNVSHDVKLEQTIFNHIIYQYLDYSLSECNDITHKTQLFASGEKQISNKVLYHFCGFTNEMNSKYKNMKHFYDNYRKP